MTPLEKQFAELKEKFPTAGLAPLAGGSHLIEVKDFPLPNGWDTRVGTLRFVAPAGYPSAQPDCFWFEPILRFNGGQVPQSSNDTNEIPGRGTGGTWFSWHVQRWHPNQDSLLTYMNVIRQRLLPAR